jgi:hypothetical protein
MNTKPVAAVGVALMLRSIGQVYDQPHIHVETPSDENVDGPTFSISVSGAGGARTITVDRAMLAGTYILAPTTVAPFPAPIPVATSAASSSVATSPEGVGQMTIRGVNGRTVQSGRYTLASIPATVSSEVVYGTISIDRTLLAGTYTLSLTATTPEFVN